MALRCSLVAEGKRSMGCQQISKTHYIINNAQHFTIQLLVVNPCYVTYRLRDGTHS